MSYLVQLLKSANEKIEILQSYNSFLLKRIDDLEGKHTESNKIKNVEYKPNIRHENIRPDKNIMKFSDVVKASEPSAHAATDSPGQSTSTDKTHSRLPVTGPPKTQPKQKQISSSHEKNIIVTNSRNSVETEKSEWNVVSNRKLKRKARPPLIIGKSTEISTVEGVEKLKAFHVSRLKPETTSADLYSFLSKNFTDVKCESLKSRYPESYASFKVLIKSSEMEKVQDATNWPKNSSVNYFFRNAREKKQDIVKSPNPSK